MRHRDGAAVLVLQRHRLAADVLRAPVHDREEHGVEVETLLREAVLVALRPLLIELALQDLVRDERVQAVAEDVPRHAGVPLQLLEAADAEERLAEDERVHRSPITASVLPTAQLSRVQSLFSMSRIIVAFRNPLV